MNASTIGIDISKNLFEVHGTDAAERVVLRQRLKRDKVLAFFARQPPALIGIEACGSAHHWARALTELGHTVRLVPPAYARAYVRRGKNDRVDAAAICEAVGRPHMRFVPVKTEAQQAVLAQHRTRDLLVRQRTMLINSLRGQMGEFGIVAPCGPAGLDRLGTELADPASGLPEAACLALRTLVAAIARLSAEIDRLGKAIAAGARRNERAVRLTTIPGIGPIIASALAAKVADPAVFRRGRDLAAWLGLTPREDTTAGKVRLRRITKQGDRDLRRLLVLAACAILRRPAVAGPALAAWIGRLRARKTSARLVTVALANKLARIAWAVMAGERPYHPADAAA